MSEATQARLKALDEARDYLIEAARLFFNKASGELITLPQQITFLRQTPFYSAFEFCLISILSLLRTKLNEETADGNVPEDLQEQIFTIISIALYLNINSVLQTYLHRVDWTDWHPIDSGDAEYIEIYRELIKRFPTLARFHKSLT